MTIDKGQPPVKPLLKDTVVPMAHRALGGRTAELEAFETYWSSMRREGGVPFRTQIDPRGIESLLGNAFVAEKIAPGLARLRIAGNHLSDVMGMEVRGMPLSSLIEPEDRDQLADALVDVFERPATLRLELTTKAGFRQPPLTGTMLILPLRSDLGDISRALGCLVSQGAIGSTPRRFSITECRVSPVCADGDDAAPMINVEDGQPFVTPPHSHVPSGPLPAERSYLKLVRDV